MPMDALKGLQEAMRAKEQEVKHQKILFEEAMQDIDDTLRSLKIGDEIEVLYYDMGEYHRLKGVLNSFDNQKLCINSTILCICMLYYIDVC